MRELVRFTSPAVLIVLLLIFVLEHFFPLRKQSRALTHRLFVNAALSILTYGTAGLIARPVAVWSMAWASDNSFGLLHWFSRPLWCEKIAGFLLLDLSFYYWHRLNHVVPFLWRFHNVHHLDPDLDVSTGFRFHFGEVALSTFFRAIQALVIGVSLPVFAVYELIFQVETYFHHGNLRLPPTVEKWFNFVIVTPRMHGIHHSQIHEETDSNYSVVFSLWDRIHRSYRWKIPQSEIRIGVPGYSTEGDNQLVNVLLSPFVTQRDYWLGNETRSQKPLAG